MHAITHPSASHHTLDPLHLVYRKAHQSNSQKNRSAADVEGSEKLMRERSIRSNRRQKFVACITSEDVSMGTSIPSKGATILVDRESQRNSANWHGMASQKTCVR